jgi:tetratricopeptide (TPR) repeat protein
MLPRAFVAMPYRQRSIESRGKIVKVDFDAVYTGLIVPALRIAGALPFRADEEAASGDIRIDMFFELVTADIVLADVSTLNTNVFYELGVRHGVSPRGVFLVHGGWTPLPFDNAPDRTLQYDGTLFVHRRAAPPKRLEAEVQRLGRALKNALEADESTTGSPVYAQLPGLRPPDVTGIQTSRSRYFGGLQEDWAARVRIARRQRRPEDILTLAESAPTRFQHDRMLLTAARALLEIQRFDAARDILSDVLRRHPEDVDVSSQLALALGRQGHVDEAAEQIERVARARGDNPEVQGTLGRAFKDMWRLRWERGRSPRERCDLAFQHRAYVDDAIARYQTAHARHPESYYNGINYLTLTRLIDHVAGVVAGRKSRRSSRGLSDIVGTVRFAATAARDAARAAGQTEELIWTIGTLGELALVLGQEKEAEALYTAAADTRDVTHFQIESMLGQLRLFVGLGSDTASVKRIIGMMERRIQPLPKYLKVVVAGWPGGRGADHGATDALNRAIRAQLDDWGIGKRSLALCSPYALPDLLFTEACIERRADMRWLLPSDEQAFIGAYRRRGGQAMVERYLAVRERVTVRCQTDHLGQPHGISRERRNDLWLCNTARAEARLDTLHTILWDEIPSDGDDVQPDRESLGSRLNELGGRLAIIGQSSAADKKRDSASGARALRRRRRKT